MPDAVDVYADQIGINLGPFGCALNFSVSPHVPPAGGGAMAGQPVATVRMSLEHLKLMTFMLRRQLLQFEETSGVQIPISQDVLNQLRIGREDWEQQWGGRGR
jgi:hypothetical protein